MGLDETFETFDYAEWAPVLVIHSLVMAISIVVFVMIFKHYKRLPDKKVTARLIKTADYFGDGKTAADLPVTASYTIAKYEYYINNRRYTVKTRCQDSIPKTIELYYKLGNIDIRVEEKNIIPGKFIICMLLFLMFGAALITIGISLLLGIEVVRKGFQ